MLIDFLLKNWPMTLLFIIGVSGTTVLLLQDVLDTYQLTILQAVGLFNQEKALLVDLREDEERIRHGIIQQSWHVPSTQLSSHEHHILKKKQPVVLFCANGYRAKKYAQSLRKLGVQDVYFLKGGFDSWVQSGMPISKL